MKRIFDDSTAKGLQDDVLKSVEFQVVVSRSIYLIITSMIRRPEKITGTSKAKLDYLFWKLPIVLGLVAEGESWNEETKELIKNLQSSFMLWLKGQEYYQNNYFRLKIVDEDCEMVSINNQ